MSDNCFFRESPFALTASWETAGCWSGRAKVLERLTRLQSSLESRSDSSLDLIWANFGSGKSHALYHLKHRLLDSPKSDGRVVCAFVEMPEQMKRFADLYSRIVRALPLPQIADLIVRSRSASISDDLRRCSRGILNGGSSEQETAVQWLIGGRPGLRELKNALGIGGRIEDDPTACDMLSGIATACAEGGQRLLLFLDEYQRAATLHPRGKRDAVLSNLRSVFSRNPKYFSMVVAVTSRIEQTALEMFPNELRSLVGMRPAVSLPEFSRDEAIEFVLGRFVFFRPVGYTGSDAAPFGRDAISAIIDHIIAVDTARVIPRTLLQALALVYDAEAHSGAAEMEVDRVRGVLNELRWDSAE